MHNNTATTLFTPLLTNSGGKMAVLTIVLADFVLFAVVNILECGVESECFLMG